MLAPSTRKRLQRFAAVAAVLTFVSGLAASPALAKITLNTIDPVAVVADDGRHIVVTGPVVCTAGELGFQSVTVTQRSTGAVAEGRTLINCTGMTQQWTVLAAIQGKATFEEGTATAVALCHSTFRGVATDAHQWLVNVTLVAE